MRDHEPLGMLLPDGRTVQNAIEVCKACVGDAKALGTLGCRDSEDAPIAGLSSVARDLSATAHGYHRPTWVGSRMGWQN